jgi:hypothetical protein
LEVEGFLVKSDSALLQTLSKCLAGLLGWTSHHLKRGHQILWSLRPCRSVPAPVFAGAAHTWAALRPLTTGSRVSSLTSTQLALLVYFSSIFAYCEADYFSQICFVVLPFAHRKRLQMKSDSYLSRKADSGSVLRTIE